MSKTEKGYRLCDNCGKSEKEITMDYIENKLICQNCYNKVDWKGERLYNDYMRVPFIIALKIWNTYQKVLNDEI